MNICFIRGDTHQVVFFVDRKIGSADRGLLMLFNKLGQPVLRKRFSGDAQDDSGRVTITLSPEDTENFSDRFFYCEVEIVTADGDVYTPLHGELALTTDWITPQTRDGEIVTPPTGGGESSGGVSFEDIKIAVNQYFEENPITAEDIGAISEERLGEAINAALAQAKESGEFNGKDGEDGADGKSAYQIWLDAGNEGTEADFLESLKAPIDEIVEKDPTVPAWAKAEEKPTYTAQEVGALPDTTEIPSIEGLATEKYVDEAIANIDLPDGGTLDHSKLTNRDAADQHPVSAITGLQTALDGKQPAGNYLTEKPTYTADEVGADTKGTADTAVANHNVDPESHNDIRVLIGELTKRFNALADSEDIDLDQLSEIIAYIQDNRELIDSVTTSKIGYSDIVDNLTTNVNNKPLSAAQGVSLKSLIDSITVPTKLSDLAEDSTHRTVSDAEKTTWDNKSDFSGDYDDLSNRPTIPIVPTNVSAFDNDASYIGIIKNTFVDSATLDIPIGYSEFRTDANITSLQITYPSGDFDTWIKFETAASGDVTVTLPDNPVFIGEIPSFGNAETWELSIKDGVIVAAKTA